MLNFDVIYEDFNIQQDIYVGQTKSIYSVIMCNAAHIIHIFWAKQKGRKYAARQYSEYYQPWTNSMLSS